MAKFRSLFPLLLVMWSGLLFLMLSIHGCSESFSAQVTPAPPSGSVNRTVNDDDDDDDDPDLGAAGSVVINDDGVTREYWVAAEMVDWDYIPSGDNLIEPSKGVSPWGDVSVYPKYRFIQYSDATYTQPVVQPQWMGILGPQFRGAAGDTLLIHFLNRADIPLSMHPHGVEHDVANDGSDFEFTGEPGAAVAPDTSFTYRWHVGANAVPGPEDPSSLVWLYHSNANAPHDPYLGLIGTIVVTRAGMETSVTDPRPLDVDEEFTTLFMVFDEEDGEEGGLMHTMNGLMFGNLQGYTMALGSRVRWHLVALGSEVDLHTAHWHGNTVMERGHRTDVIELMPASMRSVDMRADSAGEWLFHCHVADHQEAGMITRYLVQ